MALRRPLFSRAFTYVFVLPTRLSRDTVAQPGDSCDGLREFHVRELFRRNRIGPKGHEWTDAAIEAWKDKEKHGTSKPVVNPSRTVKKTEPLEAQEPQESQETPEALEEPTPPKKRGRPKKS